MKRTVVVQPGGRIEVRAPELAAGTVAEVTVRVEGKPNLRSTNAADGDAELRKRRRALQRIRRLMAPYADAFKGRRFTREELHERR